MATYVVSDLHGQYGLFMKGLEKIGFSDSDELYVLGDAIDRGRAGIKILLYIKEHKNMDLILGNHEFMMLNSVNPEGKAQARGRDANLWLNHNGGIYTFAEYEIIDEKTRKSLLFWLNRRCLIRPIVVNGKKFCLTHSYYYPEFENKNYSEMTYDHVWNIVWYSMFRSDWETRMPNIYDKYDYTFIIGHVPVQAARYVDGMTELKECNLLETYRKGNVIDIDGGCARGIISELNNGALFLRLDDMKEFAFPLELEIPEGLDGSDDYFLYGIR